MSTLYFTDGATGMTTDVADFFDTLKAAFPIGTRITVPSSGDKIDDATGELSGVWGSSGGVGIDGEGAAAHAAGVGARVMWRTAGVNNGRRVVGSTFLVPLTSAVYFSDGTLNDATTGNIQAAADALVTAQASAFTVFSRSINGGAGGNHEIVSAVAADRVSWLRSRRT